MNRRRAIALGCLAAVVALVAIGVAMGVATGRWTPAVGLIFGILPIGIYGLAIALGSERAADVIEEAGSRDGGTGASD